MQQKIFERRKVLLSFPTVNGTMLLGTLICLTEEVEGHGYFDECGMALLYELK